MEPIHRECLRSHRVALVTDLDVEPLFSHLIQEGIIGTDQQEEIKHEITRRSRAEKFLDILERRGPNAFTAFVKALDKQQPHLAKLLQKAESAAMATSLPTKVVHFLGRDAKLEEIMSWYSDERSPLMVLTGTGGFGKTSIAVTAGHQLAEAHHCCVKFFKLQNVKSTKDVICLLTKLVSHKIDNGSMEKLFDFLRDLDSATLIILDNIEDALPSACPEQGDRFYQLLREMCRASSRLKILCTSRQCFHLTDVNMKKLHVKALDPLDAKAYLESVLKDTSIVIGNDDMASILKSCGHMPLALNLIAHQLKEEYYTPTEMVEELQGNSLLACSPDTADVSVDKCISMSYERLAEKDQIAFKRISIFPSSFDRRAAKSVLESAAFVQQLLIKLMSHSMLERESTQRYCMHTLLQTFAKNKLREEGEFEKCKELFNAHFIDRLLSMSETFSSINFDQSLQEYHQEFVNISDMLSAFEGQCEKMYSKYSLLANKSVAVFARYVALHDCYVQFYDKLFNTAKSLKDCAVMSEALACKGYLIEMQGYYKESIPIFEEALEINHADIWHTFFCQSMLTSVKSKIYADNPQSCNKQELVESAKKLIVMLDDALAKEPEKKISQIWQAIIVNRLAIMCRLVGPEGLPGAKEYYLKCFDLMSWDIRQHPWSANLYTNLASYEDDKLKKSELYERAIEVSDIVFDKNAWCVFAVKLARCYVALEFWSKAKPLCQKVRDVLNTSSKINPTKSDLLRKLAEIEEGIPHDSEYWNDPPKKMRFFST